MRASILAICLATISIMTSVSASAQTVIVVRHGEKLDSSADPVLSPEGDVRAARLANMLAESRVRAIYTTQFKRTILLAAPTAKRLGITPATMAARETAALIAKIRTHAKDEVVLVVGHSNTVPEILKGLGHTAPVTVTEEDYDNLFIVAMQPGGAPTVVQLKY
jgi:broad specificity phosphatase PhoE